MIECKSKRDIYQLKCIFFFLQKILTLGEETINTSVFVQMDAEHVFLMSESLSKFVLVGEPDRTVVSSPPAKTLKLALFGSLNRKFKYDIRVHVVDDNGVTLEVSDTVLQSRNGRV